MTIISETAVGPEQLEAIAIKLACILGKGDTVFLRGELGAGKSTLARAIIREIAKAPKLEVTSPTFPILIPYETMRAYISHYDLYRLSDSSEVEELGLYDDLADHLTLIEWPEQLGENHQINDRLEISLTETDEGASRIISMKAYGTLKGKLERYSKIQNFLKQAGWQQASWTFLQGDASTRSYLRLKNGKDAALLMNAAPQPDGPPIKDGKPYSQIAHLAENMTSFVAVSNALIKAGLTAPKVHHHNIKDGLLLISDLGDDQFYHLIVEKLANQKQLYEPAIDVLVALRAHKPGPMPVNDLIYEVPDYDNEALGIESELVIDWYWPYKKNTQIDDTERKKYQAIWAQLFESLKPNYNHWVLRDYHSPNLMHRPTETGLKTVGIIDFQDAVKGHAAYDVAALCQDARLTVSQDLEQHLLNRYLKGAKATDPDFDEEDFNRAYAILGAQRASKLLGIFVRLCVRDGKENYLAHIPRIWDYLERNLKHPHLNDIFNWYETNFPNHLREK